MAHVGDPASSDRVKFPYIAVDPLEYKATLDLAPIHERPIPRHVQPLLGCSTHWG